MPKTYHIYFFLLLFSVPVAAQNLDIGIRDLGFSDLPRITFRTCVTTGDTIIPALDESNFVLTENGITYPITIRCPEAGKNNSVMMVFDNSGSINVLDKLITAGGILLDDLADADEAAIMVFNATIKIKQDFTTDKTLAKNALLTMTASGGTALWDAAYTACQELEKRSGKRYGVIFTDGADTQSSLKIVDPIIDLANQIEARLFTIAFGISGTEAAQNMERIANETGGVFFDILRPSEIENIYEEIASIITEPCCIGEYESDYCMDSVRNITLSVTVDSATAFTSIEAISPVRPEQMTLRVDIPEELTPNQSGTAYIYLDPPPDPSLKLTMSFVLHYNGDLIDITPLLPQTLGTITQNQIVTMTKISQNEMRFTFDRITPALSTNRLVGFPLQALQSDSSRIVPFVFLDSISIDGCPTQFSTSPDSTQICLCYQEAGITCSENQLVLVDKETTLFEVSIDSGLVMGTGVEFQCTISIPEELQIRSILNGNIFNTDAIQWSYITDDSILIEVPGFSLPLRTTGTLVSLEFQNPKLTTAAQYQIMVANTQLLQKCCPLAKDPISTFLLIDGLCDKIVKKKAQATVHIIPNPIAAGSGNPGKVTVSFNGSHPGGKYKLAIYDMFGQELAILADQEFAPGIYTFPLDSSTYPSGTYMAVLINNEERASGSFVIVQ